MQAKISCCNNVTYSLRRLISFVNIFWSVSIKLAVNMFKYGTIIKNLYESATWKIQMLDCQIGFIWDYAA